ncbi:MULTISPECIES: HdeD family acid-resistance protein [Parvibaculum]|uniref:HdeD family acid-resistance protein n=1 Tax=Parvibaculum TaxID=256616 RepID=UPI000C39B169|nr:MULTISPECIES: HdeD family acid-resistance protein [Parvibaculum]MAA99222.1 hypothetical protein [Stappia sp.]MAM93388.1 hypothetical protein [Parvibaculum sp.]NIJ42841.1 uncharacterized membrane protein HdeD (DUF308 family) [Parvibaculum indicum]|tara:strand:+ start:1845 stop:2414 length:570 start_codon:yes stop_codon:yes gene_type:complete
MTFPSDTTRPNSLGEALARVRSNWTWFVALGVVLILSGFVAAANLLAATVASIFVVGVAMIAGGAANVVLSLRARTWSRFFLWLAASLLYVGAGILIFVNPLLASVIFTLTTAIALVISGALRVWVGLSVRPNNGWGWIVASGVLALIAGLIIATGWPVNSLWVIGLFLSLDLLLHGWAYVILGLRLKR